MGDIALSSKHADEIQQRNVTKHLDLLQDRNVLRRHLMDSKDNKLAYLKKYKGNWKFLLYPMFVKD